MTTDVGGGAPGVPLEPARPRPAPPGPPVGYDRRRFLTLVVLAGVGFGMTAPLTVLYASGFGASDALAGLAVSSVAFSLLAVDLFGTKFVPRVDGRGVLWVSMTVFGLGSFASALAPSLGFMIGARVLQGVGGALFMGGALQVVVRFSPPGQSGRAIGAFNAAWFSGVAVGPLVGGSLAATAEGQAGYRLAFLLCGVVCLLVAVAARVLLPPIPSRDRPRLSLPRLATPRPGWRLWRPLSLAAFGQAVRGGLVLTIIPLFGERELQLDTSTVGLALSALAAVEICAMRLGGDWADRIGRRPVLVGALVVGVGACALAPVIHGPVRFGAWCAVVAVTVGVMWVVPAAVVVDAVEDQEAGLSTYRIGADVGHLTGSIAAGVLVGATGGIVALLVVGATFAAVAAWVARLPEAGPGGPTPPRSLSDVASGPDTIRQRPGGAGLKFLGTRAGGVRQRRPGPR